MTFTTSGGWGAYYAGQWTDIYGEGGYVKYHQCEQACKPHLREYYEGLLDYYRSVSPEKVMEAQRTCRNLSCVLSIVHKK